MSKAVSDEVYCLEQTLTLTAVSNAHVTGLAKVEEWYIAHLWEVVEEAGIRSLLA